jgi:hypothetical protein
LHCISRRS